jgi:putative SOS response-associated peptidase YedK
MYGRFTLRTRDRIKLKGLDISQLPFEARYNIALGQSVATIGDFGRGLELTALNWVLIPSWSAEEKGFINALALKTEIGIFFVYAFYVLNVYPKP